MLITVGKADGLFFGECAVRVAAGILAFSHRTSLRAYSRSVSAAECPSKLAVVLVDGLQRFAGSVAGGDIFSPAGSVGAFTTAS